MTNMTLITSLGWEPRFLMGVEDILTNNEVDNVLIFRPVTFFQETTSDIQTKLSEALTSKGIKFKYCDLNSGNHVETWKTALDFLSDKSIDHNTILDITTMPRYLIWACLHNLDILQKEFKCIYYPPEHYGDWLSADTGKPQMVFRHSGVAYPDRATCLLLFSGFDFSRAQNFVDFFEPKKIILITQDGNQLNNESRCVTELRAGADINIQKLDSYSSPLDLKRNLSELTSQHLDTFNVVATTVGPRPSTLALYLLNRDFPSIGLVHANSHHYNKNYSAGINKSKRFECFIDFRSR